MSRLLNKTPVLDKGFVAPVSVSMTERELSEFRDEYQRKAELDLDLATATLVIKCPIFVQLNLLQFGFTAMVHRNLGKPERYQPDVSDIKSGDIQLDSDIAQDIQATGDALLINPEAYKHDRCDEFIAQVNTPISVYNQLVIVGTMRQWSRYLKQPQLPAPMEAYRKAILALLKVDWPSLDKK